MQFLFTGNLVPAFCIVEILYRDCKWSMFILSLVPSKISMQNDVQDGGNTILVPRTKFQMVNIIVFNSTTIYCKFSSSSCQIQDVHLTKLRFYFLFILIILSVTRLYTSKKLVRPVQIEKSLTCNKKMELIYLTMMRASIKPEDLRYCVGVAET